MMPLTALPGMNQQSCAGCGALLVAFCAHELGEVWTCAACALPEHTQAMTVAEHNACEQSRAAKGSPQ